MIKNLLFCLISVLIISCHSGQEGEKLNAQAHSDSILIKRLERRIEILNHNLPKLREENKALNNTIKQYQKNLAIQGKIEKQGFINEELSGDFQIQVPGIFHGQDVKNGIEEMEWYGLFQQEEKFVLKRTEMNIIIVKDAMMDRGAEKTGKKVTSGDGQEPILFIAGLKNPSQGQVKTAKLKKKFLYPGESMSLGLNGWTYIKAYGVVKQSPHWGGGGITSYLLEISSSRVRELKKQIFTGAGGIYGGGLRFIWAGDIDGDGLIDLLMDLSNNEKGFGRTALFLSSQAEKGQLIKKVAEFTSQGC